MVNDEPLDTQEQNSSSLQGDVGYRTGSMGTGMGGGNEDMEGLEGLEGLMDVYADGDIDMIGSTDSNDPRRKKPSQHPHRLL
jgi:hypothetical protein